MRSIRKRTSLSIVRSPVWSLNIHPVEQTNNNVQLLSKRTMKNEIPHDIIIEPSSCLFFNGPFDEVKSQSVRLRNPGRHPVAWAIKTNNRTRLNADPPGSILQPGTQMMVKILSAPVRHPQMAKQDGDSIIFEWCEVEPETPFSIDLLKGDALLRRRKIKIHYNP